MCNSQSNMKEDVVIAQTASGNGQNSAKTDQLLYHASISNIILLVIVLLLGIGGAFMAYKMYRRCHKRIVERQVGELVLRRYASVLRGQRKQAQQENTA